MDRRLVLGRRTNEARLRFCPGFGLIALESLERSVVGLDAVVDQQGRAEVVADRSHCGCFRWQIRNSVPPSGLPRPIDQPARSST